MHRQAIINNPTFENELEIAKAVFRWTFSYNKKNGFKASTISLQKECMYQFT
jgi:hypothetical protein